jgi:hypothetical protein
VFFPSLQLSQQSHGKNYPTIQRRVDTLVKLEEERGKAKTKFVASTDHKMMV